MQYSGYVSVIYLILHHILLFVLYCIVLHCITKYFVFSVIYEP